MEILTQCRVNIPCKVAVSHGYKSIKSLIVY